MIKDIKDRADSVLVKTYKRFPLFVKEGSGCRLWDYDGKEYIDFVAGIAVCNLGHANPEIADAVCKQAKKLFHVSNLYYTKPQVDLASWLVKNSFGDRVFFCNSGTEAVECAIKLVRRYFVLKGETNRYKILSMEKSFHGRTMGALSATGQEKLKQGFYPVLDGFDFIPFNDIDALKTKDLTDVCAVIVEPVQGEGGVCCPDEDYLQKVREICNKAGILLIFDEIQTGMGRTGKLFCYEHYNVVPDIMTLAKALGNGVPIGAMVAVSDIADAFTPGAHASTFGGSPIITASALKVAEIFERDNIVGKCKKTGEYFVKQLEHLKSKHKCIVDVRGKGLLLGMKLNIAGNTIVNRCMEKGFLINCIQENILRFIPPLIIEREDIDALISCLDSLLQNENL